MDETYIKVRGQWKYLYRAVDKTGDTVDFLLTAKRDKAAALRFLRRAINGNGAPRKVTIDRSGAIAAALAAYDAKVATAPDRRPDAKQKNGIGTVTPFIIHSDARDGRCGL